MRYQILTAGNNRKSKGLVFPKPEIDKTKMQRREMSVLLGKNIWVSTQQSTKTGKRSLGEGNKRKCFSAKDMKSNIKTNSGFCLPFFFFGYHHDLAIPNNASDKPFLLEKNTF